MSAVTVYTLAEELEALRLRVEALEQHEHGPVDKDEDPCQSQQE